MHNQDSEHTCYPQMSPHTPWQTFLPAPPHTSTLITWGALKTTEAQELPYRDSDKLVQGRGQATGFFKVPGTVLMCSQGEDHCITQSY